MIPRAVTASIVRGMAGIALGAPSRAVPGAKTSRIPQVIVHSARSGGLTVSEALACNLPMAVFDAIPGQEEDNANFLKVHDMGVRLEKDGDFAGQISALLSEKEKLREMRENCQHFDKSQSIPNLLALIEDLVEEKP